ncbi:glycosyltransferase family 2 protein [Flavobacterium sp. UBA6135]|uniref:glycosyltransferase family 2 protein n=1 Tax=Flavobacterium sp. UBA6135 TaxID=1946553 RepID=UPI0025C0293C|nr:glycosyltransferase family 2 protein [Flavobacterium sp. UBA6135]
MLSILIPCYEYKITDLVFVLSKMMANETLSYEIIVLDDGSTNQDLITANQKINSLPNCKYLYNKINQGRTVTRNELAKIATYDTLLFLDADVIPLSQNFIQKYIPYITQSYNVVCGGYSYSETRPPETFILRWKYGKSREQNIAFNRNKNPFSYIFSGNILIKKSLFFASNFTENKNIYGLDIFFSYNLYMQNSTVLHIDNEIVHLGLEPNEKFFKKSLESVVGRFNYLVDKPEIEKINGLIKHYKTINKWRTKNLVAFLFICFESFLKKQIVKGDPNLLCFDLYRLGYMCSLKNKSNV